jgi:hypothetical protein
MSVAELASINIITTHKAYLCFSQLQLHKRNRMRLKSNLKESNALRVQQIASKDYNTVVGVLGEVGAKVHGLGSGGGLIEEGSTGHGHASEVLDQGLEVQQRLQTTLRNFSLVGSVGSIPIPQKETTKIRKSSTTKSS